VWPSTIEEGIMELPLALVLDADEAVREEVGTALGRAGLDVVTAATSRDAVEILRARPVAIVLTGQSSRDALGDLVERGVRLRPTAVVGVLDSAAGVSHVDVARAGTFDVVPRPFAPQRIAAFALRALAQHALLEELRRLRALEGGGGGSERILGRSEASDRLRRQVQRFASTRDPVVFVGEPGSGRLHAARCLQTLAAPLDPLETVAPARVAARLVERAGTVFVPALERLPWSEQEELATVLEAGGAPARFTASSGVDPSRAAGDGRMHERLASALGQAVVVVPALRERPDDVAILARAFVDGLTRLNGLPPIAIGAAALQSLEAYAWPGNVRELRDAVETAVILSVDGAIRVEDLPESVRGGRSAAAPGVRADRRFRDAKRAVVDAFERTYLSDLLRRHGGNVTGAAEHSGMLRSALQRLLRKHELRSAAFRDGPPGPSTA